MIPRLRSATLTPSARPPLTARPGRTDTGGQSRRGRPDGENGLETEPRSAFEPGPLERGRAFHRRRGQGGDRRVLRAGQGVSVLRQPRRHRRGAGRRRPPRTCAACSRPTATASSTRWRAAIARSASACSRACACPRAILDALVSLHLSLSGDGPGRAPHAALRPDPRAPGSPDALPSVGQLHCPRPRRIGARRARDAFHLPRAAGLRPASRSRSRRRTTPAASFQHLLAIEERAIETGYAHTSDLDARRPRRTSPDMLLRLERLAGILEPAPVEPAAGVRPFAAAGPQAPAGAAQRARARRPHAVRPRRGPARDRDARAHGPPLQDERRPPLAARGRAAAGGRGRSRRARDPQPRQPDPRPHARAQGVRRASRDGLRDGAARGRLPLRVRPGARADRPVRPGLPGQPDLRVPDRRRARLLGHPAAVDRRPLRRFVEVPRPRAARLGALQEAGARDSADAERPHQRDRGRARGARAGDLPGHPRPHSPVLEGYRAPRPGLQRGRRGDPARDLCRRAPLTSRT